MVRAVLERLGVRVSRAYVREVRGDGLATDQGFLPADLVLWSAGMSAPGWLESAGLPVDSAGRVRVDASMKVVGQPEVVAAGDCAASGLRMACATAMPLGCHAAETVIREARGQDARPFEFGFVQRCVSLGRRGGLWQVTDGSDVPGSFAVGGAAAIAIKEAILYGTVHMARWEVRSGVRWFQWPGGDKMLEDARVAA